MLGAGSEQPQRGLRVLDVAVRQQQQVPDAPARRQQAESSQGPPQLSAAPHLGEELGQRTLRLQVQLKASRDAFFCTDEVFLMKTPQETSNSCQNKN